MNWAMNSDLASSLDHIWRSPTFPMWLTLAAAGFFAIIMLITLLRAEKSVANGALTVITLLAIAVAAAATIRGFGPDGPMASAEGRSFSSASATLPALSCIDDLAGDAVLNACEKALFGSPDAAAAAVTYAASQLTRLTALGDLANAEKNTSSELQALRRAVERDRYGLMAYALMARDHCTPTACPAFRSLADSHQLVANMDERLYENLITRYASSWNAPPPAPMAAAPGAGLVAGLPPSMPTGRPTNADFPSAASTPPVNIMTPEPGPASLAPKPAAATAPPPAARPAPAASPALAAAKKQATPKRAPAAPVQIAPATPAAPAAQAPAASNND